MEEILKELLHQNKSLITRRDELIKILDEKIPNNLRRNYAALRKALTLNVGEILAVGDDTVDQKKDKVRQILKESGMQDSRIDEVINILVNVLELEEEKPEVEIVEEIPDGKFIPMSSEPEIPRRRFSNLTKSTESIRINKTTTVEILKQENPEENQPQEQVRAQIQPLEVEENNSSSQNTSNLPAIYTGVETVPPNNLNKIFAIEGRLNRWRYFTKSLKMLALMFVGGIFSKIISVVGTIIIFIASIGCILLSIRRLHDLDKSGFYLLLTVIPFVDFILGIYLLFAKGTEGDNQYGEDPLIN